MLFYSNFTHILVLAYSYLYVYNFTLIIFFWTVQQFINVNFKTIYAFADFKFDTLYTGLLTLCLFSMAGVPPFLGFFTKLTLLLNLSNAQFFHLYVFFFILLFFGLYFYLQNLRFLYSTGQKSQNKLNYSYEINLRYSILFLYNAIFAMFSLTFGWLFFDDLLLYFTWLFV